MNCYLPLIENRYVTILQPFKKNTGFLHFSLLGNLKVEAAVKKFKIIGIDDVHLHEVNRHYPVLC
jgi:hypothetical protein